ncbi:hypothetical protein ANN_21448 [Periplaneta americana]|uniref:Uncharacterized protein n=1 Tax=Periplaneta americana TaxID=6978 RepID=A0ABQ8SFB3_PERAM|nr:hypothetical protein ANN_21448 [Periplaneta americana]
MGDLCEGGSKPLGSFCKNLVFCNGTNSLNMEYDPIIGDLYQLIQKCYATNFIFKLIEKYKQLQFHQTITSVIVKRKKEEEEEEEDDDDDDDDTVLN